MVSPDDMRIDVEEILNRDGQIVTVKTWDIVNDPAFTAGSYDDDFSLSDGSATVSSGVAIIQPIANAGGADRRFLEEGTFLVQPSKIFLHGSITLSNPAYITDSAGRVFTIDEGGIIPWEVSGTTVYYEVFCNRSGNDFGVV